MSRTVLQLPKYNVFPLTDALCRDYTLYGPKLRSKEPYGKREEFFAFDEIREPGELRLDYYTSILPPVKVFFPNDEQLISFKLDDIAQTENVVEEEPKVLFGVHPCDLHAIHLMDLIFSSKPMDEHYLARRKNNIIIGINCVEPCSDKTLCYDKGTYKIHRPESTSDFNLYDLMMWDDGQYYIVEVVSQAGKDFVHRYESNEFFEPFAGNFDDAIAQFHASQKINFKRRLIDDISDLPDAIVDSYRGKVWVEQGEKCLSCGSCNMVCPTCYCFDTYDVVDINLKSGHRCRHWDACQTQEFACIGSGENFREKSSQRNRHRVFKKEVYVPQRFGLSGCVGCGRCNTACVANISLIDIYNRVFTKEII